MFLLETIRCTGNWGFLNGIKIKKICCSLKQQHHYIKKWRNFNSSLFNTMENGIQLQLIPKAPAVGGSAVWMVLISHTLLATISKHAHNICSHLERGQYEVCLKIAISVWMCLTNSNFTAHFLKIFYYTHALFMMAKTYFVCWASWYTLTQPRIQVPTLLIFIVVSPALIKIIMFHGLFWDHSRVRERCFTLNGWLSCNTPSPCYLRTVILYN